MERGWSHWIVGKGTKKKKKKKKGRGEKREQGGGRRRGKGRVQRGGEKGRGWGEKTMTVRHMAYFERVDAADFDVKYIFTFRWLVPLSNTLC